MVPLVLVSPFNLETHILQFSKMSVTSDNFLPITCFVSEISIGLVIESSGIDLQILNVCCLLFISLCLEVGRGGSFLNFVFQALLFLKF